MSSIQTPYVSVSLARLKRGVTFCCWIVGLSLVTQLMVWCVATFMDVRFQVLPDKSPAPLIVSPEDAARQTNSISSHSVEAAAPTDPEIVDPNRVPTKQNLLLAKGSKIAYGAGLLGMIALLPLLGLGAMLGAGSATPGVEKCVSAFMWGMMVAILIFPLGDVLGLPWREGALVSYDDMVARVDAEMTDANNSWGSVTFYCRFALLPLACIVGLTVAGMGFSAGVLAGIMPKEDIRLDPALEREAANITPASLHGGRAAAALRAASATAATERKVTTPAPATPPSITQLSAGEAPKRLI